MEVMKQFFFFGLLAVVLLPVVFVFAETPEDAGAVIEFPYYKKEERWIYTCEKEITNCRHESGTHTVAQVGKSTHADTLKNLTIGQIPILGGVVIAQSSLTLVSSKKEETQYQSWYVSQYGVTERSKNYIYKTFFGPLSLITKKFGRSEGTLTETEKGPHARPSVVMPIDSLDIEKRAYTSNGKKITTKTAQSGVITDYAVIENSRAMLRLTARDAIIILPSSMKEIVKNLPKDLLKGAVEEGIDHGIVLLPGGFIISGMGVMSPVTGKVKDAIFRDNPMWNVPLLVQVTALVSNGSEIEERPVPCTTIKVAKKTLDANCRVTVSISKKQQMRDITPQTNAAYYRYDISLTGPATKQAQAPRSSFFASIAEFFGLAQASVGGAEDEEEVPVDQNGFLIVEGADREDLPLPETESSIVPNLPSISSDISDVASESIFDTVSVDLKVNGQDGPIEVEKRDRIVLSWISEGATRCRGVWSRNDIKLSGTAAGRITRPVSIKIACINADGERADDEVRVNVSSS